MKHKIKLRIKQTWIIIQDSWLIGSPWWRTKSYWWYELCARVATRRMGSPSCLGGYPSHRRGWWNYSSRRRWSWVSLHRDGGLVPQWWSIRHSCYIISSTQGFLHIRDGIINRTTIWRTSIESTCSYSLMIWTSLGTCRVGSLSKILTRKADGIVIWGCRQVGDVCNDLPRAWR